MSHNAGAMQQRLAAIPLAASCNCQELLMLSRCTHSGYEVIYDVRLTHVSACSDGQGFLYDVRRTMLAQEHDLALGRHLPDLPSGLQTV